ncbi:MAG: glycosyl transferase [Myxococcales bacterium]|nr:glycosyl transferase [Myxococcales bacterium]
MNHYCTLFDSAYLTRGLSLYRSLERCGEDFRLHVFCFDSLSHSVLERLRLPRMSLVRLEEFETPALLAVKPTRTRAEYCWTCTSHTIAHCLDRGLPEVTYLDADLGFFQRPGLLLEEWRSQQASVLITAHRYAEEYDQSAQSGVYCVQFISFRADQRGLTVLRWWQQRCLEWCYARFEDGKFGDQKYLDDWPERFQGVHVLEHPGGGVAPWNAIRYRFRQGPRGPQADGVDVVFYHFHHLVLLTDGAVNLCAGRYRLPAGAQRWLYHPYVADLAEALALVRSVEPGFDAGRLPPRRGWRAFLSGLKMRAERIHHVVRW